MTDTHRKKGSKKKHTQPFVSYGTKEIKLLQYLKNLDKERFNLKKYSRDNKLPRSTIYDIIHRLENKGVVKKVAMGNYKITEKGLTTIQGIKMGVGDYRRECRTQFLSTHYLKYKLPISDKTNFNKSKLQNLNPLNIKTIKWNKDFIHYVYFEDSTLIVHPKTISIRIHQIIAEDTEEAHFQAFNKAMDIMKKISELGLKTASIELEPSHYERVNSFLAEFLEKIDERYYLDLKGGKKFWIDYSKDKKNDETNDAQVRERIDQFMEDMIQSKSLLSDIDKIVKSLEFLTKIECARLKQVIKPYNGITPSEKPDYFG